MYNKNRITQKKYVLKSLFSNQIFTETAITNLGP